MSNLTKWFVALPFAIAVAVVIPGLIAGDFLWFLDHWAELTYVCLTGGMWLVATAFVDVNRPRSQPDLANRLLPLGLILSVPIAVWDRTHWLASQLPDWLSLVGGMAGLLAILLGVLARRDLGSAYSPRGGHLQPTGLVQSGPYRWIRHPIYLAALIWSLSWPLMIASLIGSALALSFILPGVVTRIENEEEELIRVYGEAYEEYQETTWRLIPGVY